MKKCKWFFLVLISVLTFSCSKDDDGEDISIYGRWNFYSVIEENEELYEHTTCGKDFMEIKDDNTLWVTMYEKSCEKEEGKEGTYLPEKNVFMIKGEEAVITKMNTTDLTFEVLIKSENATDKIIYNFKR
ncbi:hypothetical protein [Aureivirga sp. CE67]|uniref:hypothetical protein n=1 Tax=Aureivirga sp. CE67 TaxID=1788983 RepID=UPI0018C98B19|nr:hypothetical protein [Aureivirga sp. CE67]